MLCFPVNFHRAIFLFKFFFHCPKIGKKHLNFIKIDYFCLKSCDFLLICFSQLFLLKKLAFGQFLNRNSWEKKINRKKIFFLLLELEKIFFPLLELEKIFFPIKFRIFLKIYWKTEQSHLFRVLFQFYTAILPFFLVFNCIFPRLSRLKKWFSKPFPLLGLRPRSGKMFLESLFQPW